MSRQTVLMSSSTLLLAVLLWLLSPYLLNRIGLGAFDPLDRICLIVLVLSSLEAMWGRFRSSEGAEIKTGHARQD